MSEEAIKLHNAHKKKCRWDPKEFCGGILWQTGCGDFRHHGPETYCPKCGGEVEEVKETQ